MSLANVVAPAPPAVIAAPPYVIPANVGIQERRENLVSTALDPRGREDDEAGGGNDWVSARDDGVSARDDGV
ncbi:MAG TPA: hypothetical protein VMN39_10965, partial [Longimicrobiaceae bacterium]|nr:hypothetical protein [Longimicrobiaceae bacterium]